MVLIWHVFQGAMISRWDLYHNNRFYRYWMPLSALDDDPWREAAQYLPEEKDADEHRCVLVKDGQGDIRITGYHQFSWNTALRYWKPLPAPPENARDLRQMH